MLIDIFPYMLERIDYVILKEVLAELNFHVQYWWIWMYKKQKKDVRYALSS